LKTGGVSGAVEKALEWEMMSQRATPNAGRRFCSSFLIVIPAYAGIQGLCLCFFYFFRIPASEWGMKNRVIAILLRSGFRHSPE